MALRFTLHIAKSIMKTLNNWQNNIQQHHFEIVTEGFDCVPSSRNERTLLQNNLECFFHANCRLANACALWENALLAYDILLPRERS